MLFLAWKCEAQNNEAQHTANILQLEYWIIIVMHKCYIYYKLQTRL